ncbi:hypothetical protein [Mycoplasmopsis columbinasalis]|uniref:DUF2304 domain-containing protein n=1 Tax=Mycoplasmopsis columbinasalis TaxID=114880 RepID=A0A449BAY8_9BACT|nr:hypothetical protein [Mycoplasmopsis columbinasalis]VEU78365.1 Uncharacterised protein [Mycoplasmopsis columbinasalis]
MILLVVLAVACSIFVIIKYFEKSKGRSIFSLVLVVLISIFLVLALLSSTINTKLSSTFLFSYGNLLWSGLLFVALLIQAILMVYARMSNKEEAYQFVLRKIKEQR